MSTPSIEIVAGVHEHAEPIAALLEPYAKDGIVLPRSAADIRRDIGDFLVALGDGSAVIGAVSLRDFGGGLQEIRSLVVDRSWSGRGVGSRLISSAVTLAESRGATRVFALTLRPGLFERQHFIQVHTTMFPQKVWSDCVNCPKRFRCDEVAVLLDLARVRRRFG